MFVNRKTAAHAPERRIPAQQRSKERVERILEKAANVFADEGYEAATMEAIAAAAETSIGSMYQFWPNKRALFDALAERHIGRAREYFDMLLAGPILDQPWPQILDASIDSFAYFHEAEPGFRAVWVGLHLTEEVVSKAEALNRELAKRIETVLAAKLPGLPPKMRPITATMVVEVFSAMLVISARRPDDRLAMLAETKTMLRRYLAPYETAAPKVRSRSTRAPR
jgi:AcrR family transcriptional regulator